MKKLLLTALITLISGSTFAAAPVATAHKTRSACSLADTVIAPIRCCVRSGIYAAQTTVAFVAFPFKVAKYAVVLSAKGVVLVAQTLGDCARDLKACAQVNLDDLEHSGDLGEIDDSPVSRTPTPPTPSGEFRPRQRRVRFAKPIVTQAIVNNTDGSHEEA